MRRKVKFVIILAVLASAVVGALYLTGILPVRDPVREAAKRAAARERWLELFAAKGRGTMRDWENVKVLETCFKVGEPAAGYEKVLATAPHVGRNQKTGRGGIYDGAVEYSWIFVVPKPKEPDETGYVVTVVVQGNPPVIRRVDGNYTVD
jgi:hypothetical protein